jgi:hypothetical protein
MLLITSGVHAEVPASRVHVAGTPAEYEALAASNRRLC